MPKGTAQGESMGRRKTITSGMSRKMEMQIVPAVVKIEGGSGAWSVQSLHKLPGNVGHAEKLGCS